jgi:UDP-glucose 4-epimerase
LAGSVSPAFRKEYKRQVTALQQGLSVLNGLATSKESRLDKKTILVTGGAGFIGSHLAESLLKRGMEVVIVDDFSNGSMSNLSGVRDEVKVLECDVSRSFQSLSELLKGFEFDGIFHLACFPRSLSLADPFRDLEVNARATINVLELARVRKTKVVFTSNSGIYGDPQYLPMDEKHPDRPSTPYDANKLVSEYYMKIYNHVYGIQIAICRLATVYGDRQTTKPGWKPVIPEFASKIQKGEPPTIYWDGEQTRDLIYVKDVVQGLTMAFLSDDTKDEVFILSTGTETSINAIFNMICRVLNKEVEPKRAGRVAGDIRRMKLSFEKANRAFGYKPEYDLEHGIKNYIEWFISK